MVQACGELDRLHGIVFLRILAVESARTHNLPLWRAASVRLLHPVPSMRFGHSFRTCTALAFEGLCGLSPHGVSAQPAGTADAQRGDAAGWEH